MTSEQIIMNLISARRAKLRANMDRKPHSVKLFSYWETQDHTLAALDHLQGEIMRALRKGRLPDHAPRPERPFR